MTTESRNTLFNQHYDLIEKILNKNYRLLIALQLERDDVSQDLAIFMLSAIDRFDPNRSESIRAYLWCTMQFRILDMKRKHKPHGISNIGKDNRLNFIFLDEGLPSGIGYELPSFDDTTFIETNEFERNLSAYETEILSLRMEGNYQNNNYQDEVMCSIQERYSTMYEFEGSLVA